jgi:hypothetical protein
MAVTLFFENAKKERAKMRGASEFIGYLRLWRRSVWRVAEKVKEFATQGEIWTKISVI